MNKGVLLLILFLIQFSLSAIGSDSYWLRTKTKDWKKSGKDTFLGGRVQAPLLDSLDSLYDKSSYDYHFYSKGEELFVLVSCTFDLYRVKDGVLEKQYDYQNRGYTCATNPFDRDNSHYLLGGKGFWASQMDLLVFDEINGTWEWVKTEEQPMDYHSSFVYQNSKGVFSLFGHYYNPRKGIDGWEPQGYFLDWESKSWKKVEIQIEGVDNLELVSKSAIFSVETQDYLLLANTSGKDNLGWNVLEKESGKMFYFLSRNADMAHSPVLEVIGNVLHYQSESGEAKTLDLDFIKSKSVVVGEVRVLEAGVLPSGFGWEPIYLLFSFVFVGGILWVLIVRRGKKEKPKEANIETIEPESTINFEPIRLLLPYSGQQLTSEVLDQLLGLDGLENFDFKRMKRSRLIKEINKRYLDYAGKELVFRDKNPDDRRFTYYKIQA
jgi:hypothetical protein